MYSHIKLGEVRHLIGRVGSPKVSKRKPTVKVLGLEKRRALDYSGEETPSSKIICYIWVLACFRGRERRGAEVGQPGEGGAAAPCWKEGRASNAAFPQQTRSSQSGFQAWAIAGDTKRQFEIVSWLAKTRLHAFPVYGQQKQGTLGKLVILPVIPG
eukprot:2846882-Pleurochrysis_carterae.AAC.1